MNKELLNTVIFVGGVALSILEVIAKALDKTDH